MEVARKRRRASKENHKGLREEAEEAAPARRSSTRTSGRQVKPVRRASPVLVVAKKTRRRAAEVEESESDGEEVSTRRKLPSKTSGSTYGARRIRTRVPKAGSKAQKGPAALMDDETQEVCEVQNVLHAHHFSSKISRNTSARNNNFCSSFRAWTIMKYLRKRFMWFDLPLLLYSCLILRHNI